MSNQSYLSIGETPVCDTPRRPWLAGVNIQGKRAVIFKPRCKLWSCPACAEINSRLWGARAYFGAEAIKAGGDAVYFLTLTSHEDLSPEGTLKVFPQAWKTLRQRVVRKAGVWSYLMVPERHKSGRMHVHLLESAGCGERWWKDNARACGLGYMVDEQALDDSGRAAHYVTKYIGKSLKDVQWPDGFRRVRVSKNWPPLPEMEQEEGWHWRIIEASIPLVDEIARLQESGIDVKVLDHSTAWVYAHAVNHEGELPT